MHRNAIKQGSQIGVQRSGFRVPSSRFRVPVQIQSSEFRVQPLGCFLTTCTLKVVTLNPEPRTLNPEPRTPNPEPPNQEP